VRMTFKSSSRDVPPLNIPANSFFDDRCLVS
jgi:hypothetical protein